MTDNEEIESKDVTSSEQDPFDEPQHSSADESDAKEKTPKQAPAHASEPAKKSKLKDPKVIALIIVLVVCLVGALAGISFLVAQSQSAKEEAAERAQVETPVPPEPEEALVENPIDFADWQARNSDIYAFITYPGTAINHPILQNSEEMDHYLKLDMDGEYSEYGELYTQPLNGKDFDDPVTVIYGHTFPDTDVMFTDLHYLEDSAFMDANPYLYVYLPHEILTYEIIAVAETDNSHILYDRDLITAEGQQAYFDSILNPEWEWAYVKDGATLKGGEDKIIQLSTCCIPSNADKRYIVTAKLVNEQKTF